MPQPLSLSRVAKAQPGWYRGDFHAHTNCSDGYHAPPQLLALARAEGLDFCAVTDHNTFAAFEQFAADADPLILPGVEVTLRDGHFNVFGMDAALPWLEASWANRDRSTMTTSAIMQRAASEGLLTSINHPLLPPWEWRDSATELRYVNCMEIWNDPSWPDNLHGNPRAVALWTAALNAGYRITALGGSDYHRPEPRPGEQKPPDRLGLPSTCVRADALSGTALLAAIRQRRAYVSMGPQVSFTAHMDGALHEIGADLGRITGMIEFRAAAAPCPADARAQLVKNGAVISEARAEADRVTLDFRAAVDPDEPAWYRLDVIDRQGQVLAITNPFFVGPQRAPTVQTFGELVDAL